MPETAKADCDSDSDPDTYRLGLATAYLTTGSPEMPETVKADPDCDCDSDPDAY